MTGVEFTLGDFDEGQRVELSPSTDAWMMGDRYGAVVKVGRKVVHVQMDRSGRVRKLHPRYISQIV